MKIDSCCCMTLRQGSIFIAILAIASSIIHLLIAGAYLTNLSSPLDSYGHNLKNYYGHLIMTNVIYFFVSMASVFLSSLMLHGIAKKKPSNMVPWLCLHFTSLIVNVAFILAWLFAGQYIINAFSAVIIVHLFSLILYTLHLYFFFVLYNYYKQLIREKSSKPAKLTPGHIYQPGYPYGPTVMPNAPLEMTNISLH